MQEKSGGGDLPGGLCRKEQRVTDLSFSPVRSKYSSWEKKASSTVRMPDTMYNRQGSTLMFSCFNLLQKLIHLL